jgi:endonuclease III
MKLKERFDRTIKYFLKTDPEPETELEYRDPFGLMVATILSAQCTDKRVNMITPALLRAYPTASAMAKATPAEIFEYIKSCTYPNNKSKHQIGRAHV